ncbi:MAG: amidohydrolase family protein [Hyphomicrobiales bacterium]|nr:amidohydrolase family protein [Hyphomicrobiales bacterium]
MNNSNLIIRGCTALLADDFKRADNVDLLIADGVIRAIGPVPDIPSLEIIDGRDFFVTPGFVNAHFHPSQHINRGLAFGGDFDRHMDLLHAASKQRGPRETYLFSLLAILEGLKAGTTSFYAVGSEIAEPARAFSTMGVRAACAHIPKDLSNHRSSTRVVPKTWETRGSLADAERIHHAFRSDVLRVDFGVANIRYASDALITGMMALARRYETGFHTHAAESAGYQHEVVERTGHREVEHLNALGVLGPRTVLAHAIHVNEREREMLAETGTHVVHCPRANAFLGVGMCPVKAYRTLGINVALGTDAAINNTSNEVRGEAQAAYHKLADQTGDPGIIDEISLFRMLTLNGARAMGLQEQTGSIEIGTAADLVLWRKDEQPFIPGHNLLNDLIFADGCRAHTVLVSGETVLANYRSTRIDEDELKRSAQACAAQYRDRIRALASSP